MIIAVDFDGTLCSSCYPEIGQPNTGLIDSLRERRAIGDKLILWTCREGEQLMAALRWCHGFGLSFDAVNDNIPETVERWGNNSRKITADIYIDDRSEKPGENLFSAAG